ncbi:MAG: hypothetical protein WBF52_00130 [Geitlerinemataceae cyanobacterium]
MALGAEFFSHCISKAIALAKAIALGMKTRATEFDADRIVELGKRNTGKFQSVYTPERWAK